MKFRFLVPPLLLLVTATCDDGVDVVPVASVSVSPSTFELVPGETRQLTVVVADEDGQELSGRTVEFGSSEEDIATVSGSGLVTAVAEGTATITAGSEGVEGTATVTVTPAPVAAVTLDPATAELEVDDEILLVALVEDAEGNPLIDRPVTWSSSDEDVATVDGEGLVTAAGGGEATITAEAEGVQGTAAITVLEDFEPTADAEIQGDPSFGTFTIPAGITVTVTGPLEVEVLGDLEIAGDLVGDCHPVTLRGQGSVTVSGTVSNECVVDPSSDAPGDLLIVAGTGYEIVGGTLATSGNGEVTNDESLTDDDFAAVGPADLRARQVGAGECPVQGGFLVSPAQGRAGSGGEGQAGGGGSGSSWTLRCQGNMTVSGTTTVTAQDGGDGGDATGEEGGEGDVGALGGDGGDGGDVRVQATGDIDFTGQNGGTTLRLTRGGHGGSAEATATVPGGNAGAFGGNGGDAGTFRVEAGGSISISPGGLTIEVGNGGNGGGATATAADGEDAGDEAATPGGDASATGGTGGSTPPGRLRASGSVSGLANVEVTGGDGGAGGSASAHGGKGGDGNQDFPAGADGGSMRATGGTGGSSLTGDAEGTIIGNGGDGGDASLSGGPGGTGWDGCSIDPPGSGGNGGTGGAGIGSGGAPGTGNPDGTHGDITVAGGTGDGGPGGDGEGPGSGGSPGDQSGIAAGDGERIDQGDNFQAGEDGGDCTPPQEVETQVMPSSMTGGTSPQLEPGNYTADLRAEKGAGAEVAQMTVTAVGTENFVDSGPEYLWSVGPDHFEFDFTSIVGLAGNEVAGIERVEVCHPEFPPPPVRPAAEGPAPVTEADPLRIRYLDAVRQIIATQLLTAVGACVTWEVPPGTAYVQTIPPEGVAVILQVYVTLLLLVS